MNNQKIYKKIYKNLTVLNPLNKTDRISDLNNLLAEPNSFCLHSTYRNGTTTLLRELVKIKNGTYIDCHGLRENSAIKSLESEMDPEKNILALDEVVVMFRKLGGYPKAMDYLQGISNEHQLILRLHPPAEKYKEDLEQRGFKNINLGKIPEKEFRTIFENQFQEINFSFLEKFIEYGYSEYNTLAKSVIYVVEALKLLTENPEEDFSVEKVKKYTEPLYPMYRYKD